MGGSPHCDAYPSWPGRAGSRYDARSSCLNRARPAPPLTRFRRNNWTGFGDHACGAQRPADRVLMPRHRWAWPTRDERTSK